jgi:hypothetical protein
MKKHSFRSTFQLGINIIAFGCVFILVQGSIQGQGPESKPIPATEVAPADVGKIMPSPTALSKAKAPGLAPMKALAPENPKSPVYQHIDKAAALIYPRVPIGDNGSLMRADLKAPGKIISVSWYCLGATCPWSHGCTVAWCGTTYPGDIQYHGDNTATWWAWTNDANNSEYVFIVHYD